MKQTILVVIMLFLGVVSYAQLAYDGQMESRSMRSHEVIQVYPNPTTDYFSVSASQPIISIAVYNLLGREVKYYEFQEGTRYFVGDLPKGMYLIQLTGRDSRLISTQRLSKR